MLQPGDVDVRFRPRVPHDFASNDLTGGIERADNEKGLNDARRRLGALGFAT